MGHGILSDGVLLYGGELNWDFVLAGKKEESRVLKCKVSTIVRKVPSNHRALLKQFSERFFDKE